MRGLFVIKDSLANKISFYHLMLLMASLPFDRFYSHLILISYAIHTLIHLKKGDIKRVFNLQTLLLQSVFLITVFGTIYTHTPGEAFTEWGKQIVILIFPVSFCLNPLDLKKYKAQLLLSFALVCTATIIYLFADVFKTLHHYQLPYSAMFSGAFTNHNFSEPIDMHATFFSMQIALSLTYLLTVLIKEKSVSKRLFYFICSAVLAAGLLQLCSKSALVAFIVIINLAIPWFILKRVERRRFIAISVSLTALLFAGILQSGAFRERFINELTIDLSKPKAGEIEDGRLARWNAAAGLIKKAPVFGYGSGSEIGLLQDAFYSKKLYNSYLNRLNAHSQYLSFLIKTGILGLLVYLATLAFGFRRAFKHKDVLFFSFMLLVAIVSLSENLLDVDKGICFYAFFFSFFTFSSESLEKDGLEHVKTRLASVGGDIPGSAIPEPVYIS